MIEFRAFIGGRTKYSGLYPIWITQQTPDRFRVFILNFDGEWQSDSDKVISREELYYLYGNESYDRLYASVADFAEGKTSPLDEILQSGVKT